MQNSIPNDKSSKAEIEQLLAQRLGRVHARQRLGIEAENRPTVFGKGLNFFHPENWYSVHSLIKYCIRIAGMYPRGQRNARCIQVNDNEIVVPQLAEQFSGFTILHLTDLHADMDESITDAIINSITGLHYDICVLTGDYRARTFGEIAGAIEGMEKIVAQLTQPIYGVLGNHDSVRMVPALEKMGVQMLLNESVKITRQGAHLFLAGIDDAHYFRVDNIEKAAHNIPHDAVSILLSHTPEIYRHAAHAEFNVLFCGHTHGGQICLPLGIPLTLDSKCPRFVGAGKWRYQDMQGYTSVGAGTSIVNARFNCPPEVTLHHFVCQDSHP